ncbi:leucine-rich repeat domain-containing protein, partial [Flavobacterium sp.]|uniref:leucine-rich repeat domain-containing protein n=1 Tax=Flavobacterium sp. TaxID=239 RepID=UPI003753234F
MKKLLFITLLFSVFANAQIVNIPDANFKTKLLQSNVTNQIVYGNGGYIKIDANNDGEIQVLEAQVVDSLNVDNSNISDLVGVSSFSNLKKLNCSNNWNILNLDVTSLNQLKVLQCQYNSISTLDLSLNINLTYLDCGSNLLTNINLLQLLNLNHLNCFGNQLTALNITGLINLNYIQCCCNQINSINLNGMINLKELYCYNNSLTNLDVSNLTSLETVSCNDNTISLINLIGCSNLKYLYCQSNQITILDLNNLSNLETLSCSGNLISALNLNSLNNLINFYCSGNLLINVDCSSNINLQYFSCIGNLFLETVILKNSTLNESNEDTFIGCNNLNFICADEDEILNINSNLSFAGLTNIVVNSYCSFIPGGNYNTITGTTKFDANNNGCDTNDLPQKNIRVNINDVTTTGASFTNATGNYKFYTQAGNFNITPSIENPTWFNFSPNTATIPFANNNNNVATQDFCITANGIHNDLEIVIAPTIPARPGFNAEYLVTYKNKGNQTVSGNLNFNYDDLILDFVSSTFATTTQSTGILNYDFINLQPFESRRFYITLNVNSPTETPAVNIGDILNFSAAINTTLSDEITSDNLFTYNQTVVGSFDPNDITCIEGESVSTSEIGNYLHYIVNFENTGTFQAENIVVKTTIDPNQFDINSLQLLSASNQVDARITGNVVEFIF